MLNPYDLKKKWIDVCLDTFLDDMTSTQMGRCKYYLQKKVSHETRSFETPEVVEWGKVSTRKSDLENILSHIKRNRFSQPNFTYV